MTPKRPLESTDSESTAKKPRRGIKVGPDNLPDGPWRRKVTKIKKDLVHKAKLKKEYAKIKAREQQAPSTTNHASQDGDAPGSRHEPSAAKDEALIRDETAKMHPTRELMLKDEEMAQTGMTAGHVPSSSDGSRRRTRRPGYYEKQLKKAEERRREANERRQEFQWRREERERKIAERDRFKRAMAKTVDKNGKKKLGRESTIWLEKVRKMVAEK